MGQAFTLTRKRSHSADYSSNGLLGKALRSYAPSAPPVNQNENVGFSNLVIEKLGKITKDYKLLSPPMGKGSFGWLILTLPREVWGNQKGDPQGHSPGALSEDHQKIQNVEPGTVEAQVRGEDLE